MNTMRLPFGTISITQTSKDLIVDCLDRGRVSSGILVRRFEEGIATLLGVKDAIAVSSGTDADTIALAVLHDFGAKRGDEVIVPALSYASTGHAVLHAGFKPVFVDIDPVTLNIDVSQIEPAITPRTRAIMPVHLMGKPARMDEINELARHYGLTVVEDAAEAWGTLYKGKSAGALADISAFSLYVAHIITSGDGGIVATDREDFAEVIRSLRMHGRACACKTCISTTTSGQCPKRFGDKDIGDRRFYFNRIGYSARMNEVEAALGLGSIENYQKIIDTRYRNLKDMMHGFKEFEEFFWTFTEEGHEKIGPQGFPFVLRPDVPFSRDAMLEFLQTHGVDPRSLFSSIPTQCGGYGFLGHKTGDFIHSEYIGLHGAQVGVHQDITQDDVLYFFDVIRMFLKDNV